MKCFLIALPLCVLGFSCERHDFEETKQLHEKHDSHAAGGHEAAHGNEGGHGKKDDGHGH